MKVLLIRHAHAVPEGPALVDDHRHLSESGRAVARAVGGALRAHGVELDGLFTSPLVRAVQTAELVAHALGFALEVRTLAGLSPGFPPQVVAQRLSALGSSIALVGHEPGISALGAVLVGRPSFPSFRPGQVSLIEQGEPRWTLNPQTLSIEQLILA